MKCFKTLLKYTQLDLNKLEDIQYSRIGRLSNIKLSILPIFKKLRNSK